MFLTALGSRILGLLEKIYRLVMWPVFVVQFNSEVLINDAEGEVQLINPFIHV